VVVVTSGAAPVAELALPAGALVVAADGGADAALALGLRVDVAIGDFDSIAPETLVAFEAAGTRLERHPAAKDATDLELALDEAVRLGARRILTLGSDGGRLDHLLGTLVLLAADRYAGVELDALLGEAHVHVIRSERTLAGEPGETISLFALGGPAAGIATAGLRYPLDGETLPPGTSRGVSNEFAAAEARIALESGVLLAIRPA
ncbi:MAG TPA: thiamine diphosphokinase, partial [Gaiellaceae bacterium]|nr:thiamine diphosphokinase [Gaiellaceae bacterium]